jgi:hypothetical protein
MLASYLVIVEVSTFSRGRCAPLTSARISCKISWKLVQHWKRKLEVNTASQNRKSWILCCNPMEGNAGRSRRLRRLGGRRSTYGVQQGSGRGAVWSKAARGSNGQRLGELRRREAVTGSTSGIEVRCRWCCGHGFSRDCSRVSVGIRQGFGEDAQNQELGNMVGYGDNPGLGAYCAKSSSVRGEGVKPGAGIV